MNKLFALIFVICFIQQPSFAKKVNVDSLKTLIASTKVDSVKIVSLAILSDETRMQDVKQALEYGNEALHLLDSASTEKKYGLTWVQKNKAFLLNIIGIIYWQKGDNETAINFYLQALKLTDVLVSKGIQAAEGEKCRSLNNIGIVYANMKNFDKGIEYFKKALDIKIKINAEQKSIANSYNNIGNLYYEKKQLDSAGSYFNQALKIREAIGDKRGIASSHINIGQLCEERKDSISALNHYDIAQKYAEEIGEKRILNNALRSKGKVFVKLNKPDQAIDFLTKSLNMAIEQDAKLDIASTYEGLTLAFEQKKDFKQAFKYYKLYTTYKDSVFNENSSNIIAELNTKYESEKKEQRIKLLEKDKEIDKEKHNRTKQVLLYTIIIGTLVLGLLVYVAKTNRDRKKTNRLLEKQKHEIEIKNIELEQLSIVASETINAVIIADSNGDILWVNRGFERMYNCTLSEFKNKYGASIYKASNNHELAAIASKAVQQQKSISYTCPFENTDKTISWIQTTLTPIIHGGVISKIVLIDTDITNLKEAEKEISAQRDQLAKKNTHILQSIDYAKKIQDAILPDLNEFRTTFSDLFVFYQPKDIVSGDLYWMKQIGDEILFSAIDCTGHGVPGAFMSIFAYNLLDVVITQFHETAPDKILIKLNQLLISSLDKNNQHIDDGMELVICNYNTKTKVLTASGCFSSLFFVRNNELTELKGDLNVMGDKMSFSHNVTLHSVNIEPGDSVYLFTDGYADQKGGPSGKKFFYKPFRELIVANNEKSMEEQKNIFSATINKWKENYEQIDDMCIFGIKF